MKTANMIESKFLKKTDFDVPAVLTIKDCSLEEVDKSGETKWILWFKEKPKGLVLNATKIHLLETFGLDTDEWVGKKVQLSHDPSVMMGALRVGGIKLSLPKGAYSASPGRPAAPQARQANQATSVTPEFEDMQREDELLNSDFE